MVEGLEISNHQGSLSVISDSLKNLGDLLGGKEDGTVVNSVLAREAPQEEEGLIVRCAHV